jgi:hypothetical protein
MKEPNDADLTRMGLLNSAFVHIIETSECTPIEAIIVLRIITNRLEKSFELSVMGDPLAGIVKENNNGSNLEPTSISK